MKLREASYSGSARTAAVPSRSAYDCLLTSPTNAHDRASFDSAAAGDSRAPVRRRAFTLVEVMIAMAILGIVIGAIYATWRCIINASQASLTAATDVQRARVVKRCFEQSLSYATRHVANDKLYWFYFENGSDAYLSFVATLPQSFPRSGRYSGLPVRRVTFSLQNSKDGGRDLVLRQQPLQLDIDEDEQNFPLVLMKNVKSMEVEILDERKREFVDKPLDNTNEIPRIVHVVLTTANPNNVFADGEQYFIVAAPASVAVQPGWQSAAGPGTPPPGAPGAPGAPGMPPVPVPQPPIRR